MDHVVTGHEVWYQRLEWGALVDPLGFFPPKIYPISTSDVEIFDGTLCYNVVLQGMHYVERNVPPLLRGLVGMLP
jgi:hypothetical protein